MIAPPLALPPTLPPRPPRRARRRMALAAALAAALVLAALAAALPALVAEAPPQPLARAATAQEAGAALGRAAAALQAGERRSYEAALPAVGQAAREAVAELYERLAPLPWSAMRFTAEPVAGAPGRYDVRVVGRLGATEPPDRIAARRVVDLEMRGSRVVVTGDATPPVVAHRYLMAFHDPVAVRRHGLLVIADRHARARALALARAGAGARTRLSALGIAANAEILVCVYSSMEDLRDALGGGPKEKRVRFFSHATPQLGGEPCPTRDIGILGPSLDGTGSWMGQMLAHEMTHAYTATWFTETRHAPTLLLEGVASAVEGPRDWSPLREEVATGNQLWPLVEALSTADLWKGNSTAQIHLAYLEGASLILYVRERWGLRAVKRWVTAVADSDLSEAGLDEATRATLGVGWDGFTGGWALYVRSLR